MNRELAFQQAKRCLDEPSAEIAAGSSDASSFLARVRALCILRLVGVLIFAGTAHVCSASPADNPTGQDAGSLSGGATGPIDDPFNPEAYMVRLASRLNSSDGKDLLLKGVQTQKTQIQKIQNIKALRANAQAAKVPMPAGVTATSAVVPAKAPAVKTSPENVVVEKKDEPATQVPAMMVWNGLSPDNRAAQRAMEHLGMSTGAQKPDSSASAASGASDATTTARSAKATSAAQNKIQVSELNQSLMSAQPGLTLWTTPTPANLVEKIDIDPSMTAKGPNVENADPNLIGERAPWSLGADLDKYRAHAVKQGARDSGESLKKALENAGLAVGDGVNVFILGYGSDRGKPFRANDGKSFIDEPGKVPERAGKTVVSFADGVYSLADLITLDSLPDPLKEVYGKNNPLVRPLIFTGQTIGGVWKTTEEVGNAVTWGLFDNVTGCVGIVIEDILELAKHVGQAATNLARAPVQLVAGKKENTEKAMDWILLVPLEFATNCAEMKGIANMDDYETAFEDKGVIGSVLELGGSTFLAYRAVDELVDKLKDDHHHHRSSSSSDSDTPTNTTDTSTVTHATGSEALFIVDGDWPNMITDGGIIYFDGEIPTITVVIE